MFRNLWYTSQFNACCYRVCFNWEIHFLTTGTVAFNRLATRNYTFLVHSPERLALEHMQSGNTTTSLVLNSILKYQKVSITPQKLEALLKG